MTKSKQKAFGMILTFAGGLIALLAFLILPYISLGDNYETALQAGLRIEDLGVWLLLIGAIVVIALSAWSLLQYYEEMTEEEPEIDLKSIKRQFAATYVMAGAAILTLLILAVFLVQPIIWPRSGIYNSGFWSMVVAQFVIIGGTLASLFALRQEEFDQLTPANPQSQQESAPDQQSVRP